MAKIPAIKKQLVPFRGPSSSSKYNEFQEDVFYDITELFNATNTLEKELDKATKAHDLISRYQEMRIRDLEQELARVTSLLDTYRKGTGKYTAYAYVKDMTTDYNAMDSEKALLDTYHGIVHLPITGKTTSKVYIYDEVTGEVITPDNLKTEVLPTSKRGWKIIDNNVGNAFNGDNNSYWHRKIIMSLEHTPKDPVTTELIVTLPENIISNKDVNMINVHPFPVNGITIDKIEYRLDGEWKLLPGWGMDEDRGIPKPINNAGNLKFCFPAMTINQVKVTMSQPRHVEENYQRVYHFGLQELGIFHVDYQSESGKFAIPMTLEGATGTKLITGIKPVFRNELALSDRTESKSTVFNYNIYTVDENGQRHYTKETFPISVSTKDIVIHATIFADPNSRTTPALEFIELTYQDV